MKEMRVLFDANRAQKWSRKNGNALYHNSDTTMQYVMHAGYMQMVSI